MASVFLLTTGDGADGNEWDVHGIYATPEAAERAKAAYEQPVARGDGSTYIRYANDIEEWELQS